MAECLYCRHDNPGGEENCAHCRMPLPINDDAARKTKRQKNFIVFCLFLTVFCLFMMFWLPRSLF